MNGSNSGAACLQAYERVRALYLGDLPRVAEEVRQWNELGGLPDNGPIRASAKELEPYLGTSALRMAINEANTLIVEVFTELTRD